MKEGTGMETPYFRSAEMAFNFIGCYDVRRYILYDSVATPCAACTHDEAFESGWVTDGAHFRERKPALEAVPSAYE